MFCKDYGFVRILLWVDETLGDVCQAIWSVDRMSVRGAF